jgi:hypothetical protein
MGEMWSFSATSRLVAPRATRRAHDSSSRSCTSVASSLLSSGINGPAGAEASFGPRDRAPRSCCISSRGRDAGPAARRGHHRTAGRRGSAPRHRSRLSRGALRRARAHIRSESPSASELHGAQIARSGVARTTLQITRQTYRTAAPRAGSHHGPASSVARRAVPASWLFESEDRDKPLGSGFCIRCVVCSDVSALAACCQAGG